MASLTKGLLSVTLIALATFLSTEAQTTAMPPLPSVSCDFESADDCNFLQDLNDDFNWIRHQGGTPTPFTGPPVDHTTGTTAGYYMYAEASLPQNLGDTAVLFSPVMDAATVPGCVEFYYSMDGANVGGLKVYVQDAISDNAQRVDLWSLSRSQGEGWHRGLVDLAPIRNTYRILVEVTIGNGHQGDIAIDDISIDSGACPVMRMKCDFEDPLLCGFDYDGTEDVRFVRRAGATPSASTGPSVDHTFGNAIGYYLYMESSGVREGMVARIATPVMAATTGGNSCLILWYHMYGEAIDTLSVYMRNTDELTTEDPLWTLSGNRGHKWWATEIDLESDNDYVLVIETRATGDYRGDIAIDDFTITGRTCPGELPPTYLQSEPLEFFNVTENSITVSWPAWNETTDVGVGPVTQYKIQYREKSAIFNDILLDANTLFHHFKDLKVGTTYEFRIILISELPFNESQPSRVQNETTLSGGPPSYIHDYPLQFPDVADDSITVNWPVWDQTTGTGKGPITEYRIQYREQGGNFEEVVVADNTVLSHQFDDLKEGTTYEFQIVLATGQQPVAGTPSLIQSQTTLCGVRMKCDFEDPLLCGFDYDGTEDVRFVRRAGATPSASTGPSVDHTFGNAIGYYLYMESSGVREGMVARIATPVMAATTGGNSCLILWYHMYGEAIDTLSVYMRNTDELTTEDPLWTLSGNRGNKWWATEIDLESDNDYVLVIETRATGDYRGDIAIDDFTITGRTCPGELPPTYLQSEPLEFFNVTENSITVSWPAWNETTDVGVGPVTQYKIQYREKSAIFNDILLDANTLFHHFKDLKVGTTYEFRIILISELPFNESQPSRVQNETTLSGGPPSYIHDYPLQFPDVVDDSITVNWPVWDQTTGTGKGPITEYRIQYREQGGNFEEVVVADNTVLSHQFDDLKEGTTYEFQIVLATGQQPVAGTPSLIQSQTTLCGDLGDLNLVLTTKSKRLGKARIVASWQIRTLQESCEINQQSITIHRLDHDECALPSSSSPHTSSLASNQRKKTFERLTANWNFNITLQVTNPSGVYTSSKVKRTAETRPEAPPSNVTTAVIKAIGWKGFRWDKPPCHMCHGQVVKYGYTIQKDNNSPAYYTTNKTLVYFNNLTPGSQYSFKVRAWTLKGSGPFSDLVTLTN